MATRERLSEENLPLEPEEFADELIAEVDGYIDKHQLAEARFEEELSEDEMRKGLYTRIYNEIMAVDLSRRMLDQIDEAENSQVFIHLMKQIEDEAKHARMLSQRLDGLGGDPQRVFERADEATKEFWQLFDDLDVIETAVVLQAGAERMAQHRHEKELKFYDEETAEIYKSVISPEEKFHAKIGVNLLQKLCTTAESQKRAVEMSREGRELTRQFHDEGVKNAYKDE